MTRDIQKPANLSYHDSDDATDPSVGLNRRELMSRGALLGAAAGAAGLGLHSGAAQAQDQSSESTTLPQDNLTKVAEADNGTLYALNGFAIPVLAGSYYEMGKQYGSLMKDHMQTAYDTIVAPGIESGKTTPEDMTTWTNRSYTTVSSRCKRFYDGLVESTGWSLEKVVMLDIAIEFGIFQSSLHSFAGCTSIFSWGDFTPDGQVYIGRNQDWFPAYLEFSTVITVMKPTDGSYRHAKVGWPGMLAPMTAINEQGVYFDVHDGSSMGGSVVYIDRSSTLNALNDLIAETPTMEALTRRMNSAAASISYILNIADETGAASFECSALAGSRLRQPAESALVGVNSFMNPDWGIHQRETASNSLRRFANMTARLAENKGLMNAARTRDLMDMRLFNDDGTFVENGGSTKPTVQDVDLTNYQTVTDVSQRQFWMKMPNPDHFADWTQVDLNALWS
jgi:hypothetical protein